MNNIVFKKIFIQNFKSIGYPIEFTFDDKIGLNFICGENDDVEGTKNGAGKSTLFDSILFALYGKTIKNTKTEYVPNRTLGYKHKKYPVLVQLEFLVDNREYIVKNTICNYDIYIKEGSEYKSLTKSSKPQTKKFVEQEILKIPYDIFKNSIILSSSDVHNFFTLGKGAKRHYIECMFNLTVFGKMLSLIRADLNIIDKEITLDNNKLKTQNKNKKEFEEKFKGFSNEKKEKLKNIIIDVKRKKNYISDLKTEFSDNEVKKIEQIKKSKLNADNNIEQIQKQISNKKQRLTELNANLKHNKISKKKFDEVLDIICRKCYDKIDKIFNVSELSKNIDNFKKEIELINEEAEKLKIDFEAKKEILENFVLQLKSFDKQKVEFSHNKKTIDHIRNDLLKLKENIQKLKNEENPFETLINNCQKEIESINEDLQILFDKRIKLDILQNVVNENGAKRFIIKDIKDVMNVLIRKYLNKMGAAYTAIFDEKFDCTFITNTGECDYTSFSAGERKRIDIALLFAFRDILSKMGSVNSNILVVDELIDAGIDEFAIISIINMLKEESKNKAVFLISHRESVDLDNFDNTILVRKKNDMSFIDEGEQSE